MNNRGYFIVALFVGVIALMMFLFNSTSDEVHQVENSNCPNGHYRATGQCHPYTDLRGKTRYGESGAGGGFSADGTADNFDDDGDGYCEIAPCVGSRNPVLRVEDLRGGDCDDNPNDSGPAGGFSKGKCSSQGICTSNFVTDGSYFINLESSEWVGDNFDNNCDGVVDGCSSDEECFDHDPLTIDACVRGLCQFIR